MKKLRRTSNPGKCRVLKTFPSICHANFHSGEKISSCLQPWKKIRGKFFPRCRKGHIITTWLHHCPTWSIQLLGTKTPDSPCQSACPCWSFSWPLQASSSSLTEAKQWTGSVKSRLSGPPGKARLSGPGKARFTGPGKIKEEDSSGLCIKIEPPLQIFRKLHFFINVKVIT